MLDPDIARAIRLCCERSKDKRVNALEYTTRSAVVDPVLAHAIRSAPTQRQHMELLGLEHQLPPRRQGRDRTDCPIRDALILMAVDQVRADGLQVRAACREVAQVVQMLSPGGVCTAYYRARRSHPI